jgi:hypothetical protein
MTGIFNAEIAPDRAASHSPATALFHPASTMPEPGAHA